VNGKQEVRDTDEHRSGSVGAHDVHLLHTTSIFFPSIQPFFLFRSFVSIQPFFLFRSFVSIQPFFLFRSFVSIQPFFLFRSSFPSSPSSSFALSLPSLLSPPPLSLSFGRLPGPVRNASKDERATANESGRTPRSTMPAARQANERVASKTGG